jgi:hypothetical protein
MDWLQQFVGTVGFIRPQGSKQSLSIAHGLKGLDIIFYKGKHNISGCAITFFAQIPKATTQREVV